MKKSIKIHCDAGLLNDIISQIKRLNEEEENQIKFLKRNEFSMVGMEYYSSPSLSLGGDFDLVIEAENPMLFYKLGLYTAPLIKKIFT